MSIRCAKVGSREIDHINRAHEGKGDQHEDRHYGRWPMDTPSLEGVNGIWNNKYDSYAQNVQNQMVKPVREALKIRVQRRQRPRLHHVIASTVDRCRLLHGSTWYSSDALRQLSYEEIREARSSSFNASWRWTRVQMSNSSTCVLSL
jgi:hypothetical protein